MNRTVALATTCLLAALPLTASATTPNRSPLPSIQDVQVVVGPQTPAERIARMADIGAKLTRIDLRWDLVATARPGTPRDPADPVYDWARYDAIVDAARAKKIEVLFTVWGTPAWAADPAAAKLRGDFPGWAVRPEKASEFGDFAHAVATRYSPRGVKKWEAWNEPNIALFLLPQFERKAGKWENVSAETYSGLAKAFYKEVKAVDPAAEIGGIVTAPVGERCPAFCPSSANDRTYPGDFIATLNRPALRPPMDVVSHHPYPQSSPRGYDFAGATYIDLYNLARLEKAVDATYLKGKKLWLTEIGFSTAQTDNYRTIFPPAKQAEYLVDAYRRLRQNPRIKVVTWYFLQDTKDWTSGLLNEDGTRKPSYDAFVLPVSPTVRSSVKRGTKIEVLGQIRLATGATKVRFERRDGNRWVFFRTVPTGADGSFHTFIAPTRTSDYRVRWSGRSRVKAKDSRTSFPFKLRVLR